MQLQRYSNRLEVQNPGYSLKALENLGEPGSQWRNPVIASVLHEMGLAETKGSGIRVMRRLMEEAGLSPPSFDSDRHSDQFSATYLFHHFLSEEDIAWLGQFQHLGLGEDEQRALIFVRETGRLTNSDYRDLNRVDTLAASQRLAHLRDMELVEQVPRGPATYYVPGGRLGLPITEEEDDLFSGLSHKSGGLSRESEGLSTQSEALSTQPGPLSTQSEALSTQSGALSRESLLSELPESLRDTIRSMGQRSQDTSRVESILLQLCAFRPFSLQELSTITGRNRHYLRHRYLRSLLRNGRLRRKYPDEPSSPDQAYIATGDYNEGGV
ncbi:MAG: ATP-binding protein [Pseudomonadota bacterium]